MLPGPLAPLDPHKTRALTTIYAPRKLKTRKNKTAKSRMLENDIPIKSTLSPFHPLPAIGKNFEKSKTKVIVFDLNKNQNPLDHSIKIHEVLKPLTPLRIHRFTRKSSLDSIETKPQQLLRENTYDVIKPVYLNPLHTKIAKESTFITDKTNLESNTCNIKTIDVQPKVSPKTRFKNAALQVAKLSAMPQTGKLLCLRERKTCNVVRSEDGDECIWKLQELPQSPAQNLDQLSEIFKTLEMKGRHREKVKKENSWF